MRKYFFVEDVSSTNCGCEGYCSCEKLQDIVLKEASVEEILNDINILSLLRVKGYLHRDEIENKYPNLEYLNNYFYGYKDINSYDKKLIFHSSSKQYNDIKDIPPSYCGEKGCILREININSLKGTKIYNSIIKAKEIREKQEKERERKSQEAAIKRAQKRIEKAKKILAEESKKGE